MTTATPAKPPISVRLANCRSCFASIFWALSANGKRVPMNSTPDPAGQWVLLPTGIPFEVLLVQHAPLLHEGKDRFTSHFATCVHSKSWRKKR